MTGAAADVYDASVSSTSPTVEIDHSNPVPLHEVYERWVRKFERQRLSLLHDLKKELEGE